MDNNQDDLIKKSSSEEPVLDDVENIPQADSDEPINSEAEKVSAEDTVISDESKIKTTKKKKKKLSVKTKVLILCGIILATIIIFIVFLFFYLTYGLKQTNLDRDFSNLGINNSLYNQSKDKNIINVALFGIDTRTNSNTGLSDAIMIASIDQFNGRIKLTSIARDTMVPIDGHGKTNKINAAYSYGGAQLAIKTLNQNFGLDIQDYVTVNFNQLSKVIDTAGGVTINITEDERIMANGIMFELTRNSPKIAKSGNVLLTGDQAVAYCRIRYIGTDTARMERQRTVLQALLDKAKQLNPIDLANTIHTVMPMVETSLSFDKILNYSGILTNKNLEFIQMAFPNSKTEYALHPNDTVNGVWYFIYDLDVAKTQLRNFIYNNIKTE